MGSFFCILDFITKKKQYYQKRYLSGCDIILNYQANGIKSKKVAEMNSIHGNNTSQKKVIGSIFYPTRTASWWSKIDDLLWPEKKIRDRIRKKAYDLSEAGVDTVVHIGFLYRFDFAPYFASLHGYLSNISMELKKYGIRLIEAFSCNLTGRPNSRAELLKLHSFQRHCVNLHMDDIAARDASYAGYSYNSLREIDIRTGEPAYCDIYQIEMFCHNNPEFLEMNRLYLERLLSEVPLDGIQADDMADYGGFASCGCRYCRERFKREYGYELPPFANKDFWGDTSGHPFTWGNYKNPVFRKWTKMRFDSVNDHLGMIRDVIGKNKVLMICCASTGPNRMNSLAMKYDDLVKHCDWVMLENTGIDIGCVNWLNKEPEAMLQRSYARRDTVTPQVLYNYTVYKDGAYLGLAIARFWGVNNWCSTLIQGITEDDNDMKEESELIGDYNRWEMKNSELYHGADDETVEIRLVFNRQNKENGWIDEKGRDHWHYVSKWSREISGRSIGYKIIRIDELENESFLLENTPVILDGCACISDKQLNTLKEHVIRGGNLWISKPFCTHDENGYLRDSLPADTFFRNYDSQVSIFQSKDNETIIDEFINTGRFFPRITWVSGEKRWSLRLRIHCGRPVLHILNRALEAVAHPYIKDEWSTPEGAKIMRDIISVSSCGKSVFDIDFSGLKCLPWRQPILKSPEIGSDRSVKTDHIDEFKVRMSFDLSDIRLYAVIQ